MAPETRYRWLTEGELDVDGVRVVARTTKRFQSTVEQFCLVKRPGLVEQHIGLLVDLQPASVVEPGGRALLRSTST